MKKNNNKTLKVFLITIGVIGFFAGIFLALNGYKIMGIAGSMASAGVSIKGINDLKKDRK